MNPCRACGAVPPAGARFCPACGARSVGASSDRGERRVVSVLFAELVNVEAVARLRDAEAVRDLLDRCFAALAEVVVAHGGEVDKITGGELMAVFGMPSVHEDDAERAVRAGLGLVDAMALVEPEVVIRVGVNTGEVLAAQTGLGGTATVTGDAVNTAHRLVSVARPSEVLVGERTWVATRGAMELESRTAFRLRGKREEVRAFAAVGALGLPGERPWQSRTTPLVGRDGELDLLRQAARRAFQTARPTTVAVAGEAGMGKTRLVLELQAELWDELPTGLFLWGRCPSYGAAPGWPLAEALRAAFGIDDTDSRVAAHEKFESALDALAEVDGTLSVHSLRDRLRQLLGVRHPDDEHRWATRAPDASFSTDELLGVAGRVLGILAAAQPTVVVLDDLHWADEALLRLLHDLPASEVRAPLLVVAVGRTELLDGDRTLVPGGHPTTQMTVQPLSEDDADGVLRHLLSAPHHPSVGTPPPTVVVEDVSRSRILVAAAGNPFFLEELVNYLLDTGALHHSGGRWVLSSKGEDLPDSVRAVIGARLDVLPESERRFLQDAAVAGRQFDRQAVTEVGRWQPDEAELIVSALVQRGLLERRPTDELGDLAFRHVLTRDVAYASVPLGVRAVTHTGIAAWMERRFGEDPGAVALSAVAHHYEQVVASRDQLDEHDPLLVDRAGAALLRAARRAARQGALDEAGQLLGRARQLLGEDDGLDNDSEAAADRLAALSDEDVVR